MQYTLGDSDAANSQNSSESSKSAEQIGPVTSQVQLGPDSDPNLHSLATIRGGEPADSSSTDTRATVGDAQENLSRKHESESDKVTDQPNLKSNDEKNFHDSRNSESFIIVGEPTTTESSVDAEPVSQEVSSYNSFTDISFTYDHCVCLDWYKGKFGPNPY